VSFLADLLVVVLIGGAVVLLAAVATFFLIRRRVRRQLRRVQDHVATRGLLATLSMLAQWRGSTQWGAPAQWQRRRVSPDGLRHGSTARVRRQMWTAIEDAEEAVRRAEALNAPVADLPGLCRTLRRVGGELDHLLDLERRLPADHERPDELRRQLTQVVRAAGDVQSAALRACSEATGPQVHSLVRDVRDEVEIVAAALSRLRSVTSP
jgi:hypothetical protein